MANLEDLLLKIGKTKTKVAVNGTVVEHMISFNGKNIFITFNKETFEKLKDKVIIIGFTPSVTRVLGEDQIKKLLEKNKSMFVTLKNIHMLLGIPYEIAKFLYENPNSHIRAIARRLKLHPQTVKRWLDRGSNFLEIKKIEGEELPNLPVLVRLKEGVTPELFAEVVAKRKIPKRKNARKQKKRKNEKYQNKIKGKMEQIGLIAKFLYENPNSHIRAIARNVGIPPSIVYRRLKEIENFIVTTPLSEEISKSELPLPNLPVLVRLKEGVTPEGIIRYLRFKMLLSKK